jgi:hypothetical protein
MKRPLPPLVVPLRGTVTTKNIRECVFFSLFQASSTYVSESQNNQICYNIRRVWGGAKYDGIVQHIFQVRDSKFAHGTEGVLDAYQSVFETDLTKSGPTLISDVLRAAAGRARRFRNDPNMDLRYCILLILTNRVIHGLPYMQDLVQSYRDADLPLLVIVVGIGRADFTEFHQWDLAPPELHGRFKFVEFREHQTQTTSPGRHC